MKIIINLRQDAKNKKEWGTSDKIRDELKNAGDPSERFEGCADWKKL